jgi:CheY-like chemotaxis protein
LAIVHEANSAQAALGMLESRDKIDLLIVEYAMARMNGLETIRQARRRRSGPKLLLIAGDASTMGGSASGVAVLREPFAVAELARKVAEIVRQ